jgi:hypothetical protein
VPDISPNTDEDAGRTSVRERKGENTEHATKLLELLKLLESPRGNPSNPAAQQERDSTAPLKRLDALPALPTASSIEFTGRGKQPASRTDSHISSVRMHPQSLGSARSTTRDKKRTSTSSSPRPRTTVDEKSKGVRFQQGSLRPVPMSGVDKAERKVKFEEKQPKLLLQRSHAQTTLRKWSSPPQSPASSPTDSPRKPSRLGRLLSGSGITVDEKKAARRASLPDRSRTEGKQAYQDGFRKRINKSLSPRKNVDGMELRPKSPPRLEEKIQLLKAEIRFLKDAHKELTSENDELKQLVHQLTQRVEILLDEKNKKQ